MSEQPTLSETQSAKANGPANASMPAVETSEAVSAGLRCAYSGVPIHVSNPQPGRAYFVTSACAIKSRIPVDAEGNFPINRPLIAVLTVSMLIFNQALFWLLAVLMDGRGKVVGGKRFLVASVALGAALWLLLAVFQWRSTGGGSVADKVVLALTAALVALGVIGTSPACSLGGVALLVAWGLRIRRRA